LKALLFLSSLVLWMCHPTLSQAQVLEIGEDGVVTVHDGPAVFTPKGAEPIQTPTRPARTRKRAGQPDRAAIASAAEAAALSPELIEAVAWRESRIRSGVVSPAGAVGEMQLMPATARMLGVDPLNTRQNLNGGAAYLRVLMQRYNGDLIRSLAAYNAGPKAVDRYGGMPPYKETQAYVADIMARLSQQVSISPAPQPDGGK